MSFTPSSSQQLRLQVLTQAVEMATPLRQALVLPEKAKERLRSLLAQRNASFPEDDLTRLQDTRFVVPAPRVDGTTQLSGAVSAYRSMEQSPSRTALAMAIEAILETPQELCQFLTRDPWYLSTSQNSEEVPQRILWYFFADTALMEEWRQLATIEASRIQELTRQFTSAARMASRES